MAEEKVQVSVADLSNLIRTMQENQPVRKVSHSKHEPRSPFAQGRKKRDRAKLERTLYTNGFRLNPKMMFDSEIVAANKLVEGQYLDKLVVVQVRQSNTPGDPDTLYVNYPNRKVEQRFHLAKTVGNSLTTMFEMCNREAEALKASRAAAK